MKPGSGTYIRSSLSIWSSDPFSLLFDPRKEVHLDLFEARKGLEGIIGELAAQKRTEEDLQRMEDALQDMEGSAGDEAIYIRHEIEFNQAILRAARNIILSKTLWRKCTSSFMKAGNGR